MTKNFCLVFPYPFTRVHLTKETGKIPEVIARKLGWRVIVLRTKGHSLEKMQPDLDYETPHLEIHTVPGSGTDKVQPGFVRFLLKNARRIDVLMLMHSGRSIALYGLIYKWLNPDGFLWNKAELHEERLQKLDFFPKSIRFSRTTILQRAFVRRADLITAESQGTYQILAQKSPPGDLKVAVLPCGVDAPLMPVPGPGIQRENLILTVGRIGTEQKAVDVLLKAYAGSELWKREWRLALVGPVEPEFQVWLNRFAEQYPEAWKSISMPGNITSRQELANWYARAKVFCLTSRYESWGLVLNEAGFYGCGCVSSNFSAAVDMLDGGRCGILFPRDNVEELSTILTDLSQDELRIEALGLAFQKRVLERFTWDAVIQEWIRLYSSVLENRK